MSSPGFRMRSHEVRAESRALMLKLRTERLATSRAGAAKQAAARQSNLPAQTLQIVAEPHVAPVVAKSAAKPAETRIIVSRSIQAAAAPLEPVVVEGTLPAEEPVAAKPVRKPAKPRAKKAPVAAVVEALPEIPEVLVAAAPVIRKPKAAKHASEPVVAEPEAQPDHGPAVALQNAVADAVLLVQVKLPAAEPKPSKRMMTSVAAVPSLGPGMIWRLNQIGIKTLQDMADIEADDLRMKLGSVAKLVRVENWIAFARAA